MRFRSYLLLLAIVCALLSCNVDSEKSSEDKKYNVLWLVAEDQSPQFFSFYGDSTISLPALEGLANESIIYDNAFANVPVCAPARSTIILGQYVIANGTHNMRTYKSWAKENEPSISIPNYTPVMEPGVRMFPKYLRSAGYYCTNNAKEDYNFQKTDGVWDESSQTAHWDKRSENQPFFSVFNFNECHESGLWRYSKEELIVDPKDVPVPPYFPDNDTVRHDIAVNYSNLKRIDDKIAVIIDQLKAEGLYDDTYIFFYGDHGGPFPRHKRSLYDTGIEVPLIVKLPKDLQKESTSARTDEIVSFVDLAPTMLSMVGLEKPDHMHGKAFLGKHKDLANDFVYTSSDRFDAVYDRKRAVRSKKYKYIKNFRTDLPYALPVAYREQIPMMRNLRKLDEDGKLGPEAALWMRETKDVDEFYDLENDPFELNNLIERESLLSEIERHRTALNSWLEETDDQGQFQEQDLIEKWSKRKGEITLKKPVLKQNNGKLEVMVEGDYGNIVYRLKGDEAWMVFSGSIEADKQYEFKTVHIGLDDSAVVMN